MIKKILTATIICMLCISVIHSMQQLSAKEKLLKNVTALQKFLENNESSIQNGINISYVLCMENNRTFNRYSVYELCRFCRVTFNQTNLTNACSDIDELCEPVLAFFRNNEMCEYDRPSRQEKAQGSVGTLYARPEDDSQICRDLTTIYLIFLKAILNAYNQVCEEDESFRSLHSSL